MVEGYVEAQWQGCIGDALAALTALREPSETMVISGSYAEFEARRDGEDQPAPAIWQAMIDAALVTAPEQRAVKSKKIRN